MKCTCQSKYTNENRTGERNSSGLDIYYLVSRYQPCIPLLSIKSNQILYPTHAIHFVIPLIKSHSLLFLVLNSLIWLMSAGFKDWTSVTLDSISSILSLFF